MSVIRRTVVLLVVAVSMGTIANSAVASASANKHAPHVPTTKLAASQFGHDP